MPIATTPAGTVQVVQPSVEKVVLVPAVAWTVAGAHQPKLLARSVAATTANR
jgi:hypothetical protein